jgi:hypothetical protein
MLLRELLSIGDPMLPRYAHLLTALTPTLLMAMALRQGQKRLVAGYSVLVAVLLAIGAWHWVASR